MKGRITYGKGKTITFKDAIFIMTSNILLHNFFVRNQVSKIDKYVRNKNLFECHDIRPVKCFSMSRRA